jgi:hypothetical protein
MSVGLVKQLVKAHEARLPEADLYGRYYSGNHRLAYATSIQPTALCGRRRSTRACAAARSWRSGGTT